MDMHDKESQDVDLTILSDHEQPINVAESANAVPEFQFWDGRGTLQNSTDRPIEGFVALKISYAHVFKKQKEHARVLQQKNQQLVAEIQQLKKQNNSSMCQEEVTNNSCDIEVQTELLPACSDKDISHLHLQLKKLEAHKTKLRSGLVQLAKCLLKKEQSSYHVKKILCNLQSFDYDLEESVMELDNLVKVMSDMDEDSTKLLTSEASDLLHVPPCANNPNLSANGSSPKESSSQKLVTSYMYDQIPSQISQNVAGEIKKQLNIQNHNFQYGAIDSEALQEEDMYGIEGSVRYVDVVSYNMMRLHKKLMKLQSFPAEYRSMMQQFNTSLEQQRITMSLNGDPFPYQRKVATELRQVSNESGLLTGEMSSLVDFPDIKVPPSDSIHQPIVHRGDSTGEAQVTPLNNESTDITICSRGKVTDVCRQNRSYPLPQKFSPFSTSEAEFNGTDLCGQSHKGHPDDGKVSQEEFCNARPVQFDSPKNTLPFKLIRGPPTTTQVIMLDIHKMLEWQSGSTGYVDAPVYQPPSVINSNALEKEQSEQHTFLSGAVEAVHQVPKQLKQALSPSTNHAGQSDKGSRSSEWTCVKESSSRGLYKPNTDNKRDELAKACGNLEHITGDSIAQMICPVCQQTFPPGTPETNVSSHVNLHFDETRLNDEGYEILNPC